MVWVFPDEKAPVKFKRNRSASKQMIACFFAKFGHVATIPLEDRKTVTVDWYVNHCLPKNFQAWVQTSSPNGCPWSTAPSWQCQRAHSSCNSGRSSRQWHPPTIIYSHDLVPCDWFLFPSVRRQLKGKQFQNAKDARAFFEGVILDIPQSTWSGVIDSWFERIVISVQAEGGFFEKLEWTEWW